MSFTTTILPSGHKFTVDADENILEAGLRQGFTLPYSCRDGVCGACKGKIIQGEVDYGKYQASTLSAAEKSAGMALFCCAKPKSDLVIECREVSTLNDIPVKLLPTRVHKLVKLADDVMVIYLKLPKRALAVSCRTIHRYPAKNRQTAQLLPGQCPAR